MENSETILEQEMSAETSASILYAGKWAKIQAILSIVGIALSLIMSLWSMRYGQFSSIFGSVIGVVISGILAAKLLQFNKKASEGIYTQNINQLDDGIYELKIYHQILGILGIIALSIFALVFLVLIIVAVFKH
jgi:hypothetical protein